MNQIRRWMKVVPWLCAVLIGLIGTNLLSIRWQHPDSYHVDVGFWGDLEVLDHVFAVEKDLDGVTYRWSSAETTLRIHDLAHVPQPRLIFKVGGTPQSSAPRQVRLLSNDVAVVTLPVEAGARQYELLLPPNVLRNGDLDLTLRSPTSQVAPDTREVGIRLDDIVLRWSSGKWILPRWQALLSQLGVVVVGLAIAWRLNVPRCGLLASAIILVLLLAWMSGYNVILSPTWHFHLLAASAGLLVLAWNGMPWLERVLPAMTRSELRLLAALTVLMLLVRLVAVTYPAFATHDQHIHRQRLLDIMQGSLYLFDRPTEFARRITVVPPAFYMIAMPLVLLVPDPVEVLHWWYAMLDGFAPLLTAILVLRLKGSTRAAILAALMIASLPIQFTAVWWGFGPQIAGQWLLLLLALFAADQPSGSHMRWFLAGMIFSLVLMTHPGVALLGGVWLSGYVLLLWFFQRKAQDQWLGWGSLIIASVVVATVLLYGDALQTYVQDFFNPGAEIQPRNKHGDRLLELGKGIRASLRPVSVLLSAASLALLVCRVRGMQRWLVVAWLGSAGLFLSVDVVLGLQVRYGYFMIPLLCTGLALLLDRFMQRQRVFALAGWCMVGLIAVAGLNLWYSAAFEGLKPPMAALTH